LGAPVHESIEFDVWGCRGSRNFVPDRSRIGNLTACYSLLIGEDLFVLDAGRGLAALGQAVFTQPRYRGVARVHILVTHAHMDHWEGLKDADWFWARGNGLKVAIWSTEEGLGAIRRGHEPPSYVPLDMLAEGTLASLSYCVVHADETRDVHGVQVKTSALYHYSGETTARRVLDTVGFRLEVRGGPVVCYLSDHEPGADTRATEQAMLAGAHLAVFDSHFPDISRQAHGHGSQEHTAAVARQHPGVLILAGHHGPMFSDEEIRATHARHGADLGNFEVAVEGSTYVWDPARSAFGKSVRDVR
jgi:phosphoribosyl 1,2-cyclic phosphodiesterase